MQFEPVSDPKKKSIKNEFIKKNQITMTFSAEHIHSN